MADGIPARPDGLPARAEPVPLPATAGNKLDAAADQFVSIWREHRADPGLLHVVFHDPVSGDGDPHGEFREELVARGISRSAIGLTRETGEPVGGSRNDTVSVLITSTDDADMAAVAAHGRDIAVHHLDLPRSVLAAQHRTQAVSAATSGNSASLVFRYVTTGTPDSLRWEALDRKEAFIAQVLAHPPELPAGDDGPSDSQMSYDELKALAAGQDGSWPGPGTPGGASIQGRLPALEYPQDSPFRPGYTTRGRPVRHARGDPAARPVHPPRPPGR